MDVEELYDFELKYQEVYDRTKDYTRNDFVIELIKKDDEKQELIEYLKEKIESSKGNDTVINGMYFKSMSRCIYEEILSKIEKI